MYLYPEKPFGLVYIISCKIELTSCFVTKQTHAVSNNSVNVGFLPLLRGKKQSGLPASCSFRELGTEPSFSPGLKPPVHFVSQHCQSQQEQMDQEI